MDIQNISYQNGDYSDGVTNLVFRLGNCTPVHGVFGSSNDLDDISDDEQTMVAEAASVCSCKGQETPPERFSLAVQTTAPSTIAAYKQNNMTRLKTRSVSLV